ncbi:MAG TPA: homoserine O-acetyltransferase [Ktedonobacteraceae bacterium]|nr:homoserine O-acetyltransferase [Ktedonobacteraceae bacterium]
MVTQIKYERVAGAAQPIASLASNMPGATAVNTFTFDALPLQLGGSLGPVTLAYETWGTLNATGDNAILITHALTGNTHAHDAERPNDTKIAWWNPLIGPGRFFDTSRYFVICSNILGGCYGSTGPSSIDPDTGQPYRMNFPVVTIQDMVRAQRRLIAHLGVRELAMVAGGSIGGQQALEWAFAYPELVRNVIVVAATAALTAQAIAFSEVQRQAILIDPRWQSGNYSPDQGPDAGLAIARMLAMITYQSEEGMEQRFARQPARRSPGQTPVAPGGYGDLGKRFDVENYLYYQGDALVRRFDANSYLYISRAMDLYDAGEYYSSLEAALRRVSSKALFIGIRSDFLFPAARVRLLSEQARDAGADATYVELDSPHGHDAFLKEWKQMNEALNRIKE